MNDNSQLASDIAQLTSEKEQLKKDNDQLKADYAQFSSDIALLTNENEQLKKDKDQLDADNTQLKSDIDNLTSANSGLIKEIEDKNTSINQLQDELALYQLGDLNHDGRTDIDDVVFLVTMSQYSSDSDAIATLAETNSITITEIADKYGDVEYYTLDGKRISQPTAPGIYIVKKGGITKKIVLKK